MPSFAIMALSVQAPVSPHSSQDTTKQKPACLAQLPSVREGSRCFPQQQNRQIHYLCALCRQA